MGSRFERSKAGTRKPKDTILIVCCGETERLYFEQFRKLILHVSIEVPKANKKSSPTQVVNKAIQLQQKGSYLKVWAVFDKDDFQDFDQAIQLAKTNDITPVFSNQAFELWFINHFEFVRGQMHRNKYQHRIEKHIRYYSKDISYTYSKTDAAIFDKLQSFTDIAITNTKKGHQLFIKQANEDLISSLISRWESATNVYELVCYLKTLAI